MPEPAPLVSVVLSFRNEVQVIPELVRRLQAALRPLPLRYELVFVNDASTDGSLDQLCELRREDPSIKVVNTSRRYGVSECTLAGLRHARGDAVVYMDADLQDPPEVLPELIAKWREGADVVYTVRRSRQGERRGKIWLTRGAYRVINALSEIELPVDAGDFRLLSRRVVNEVVKLEEAEPYLRGLVAWVGFRQAVVQYDRAPRPAGETHFPLLRSWGPLAMFLRGLTSSSVLPLVLLLPVGLALVVAGALVLFAVVVLRWDGSGTGGDAPWYAALALATGVQLLGIGTVGAYLARVVKDVRRRPSVIVSDTIGFDRDGA